MTQPVGLHKCDTDVVCGCLTCNIPFNEPRWHMLHLEVKIVLQTKTELVYTITILVCSRIYIIIVVYVFTKHVLFD